MPVMPPIYRPRGARSSHDRRADYDRERGSAHERGYGRRWQKARLAFLRANPICVKCDAAGVVEAATVVDHIKPHRGDQALFWDQTNWQALCKPHHDGEKQREERQGLRRGR
jgi:5-methylcytosine-specific restriction protein A